MAVGAAALVNIVALSNVCYGQSYCKPRHISSIFILPFVSSAFVHLDPSMQVPMAFRRRNLCNSGHHHDG